MPALTFGSFGIKGIRDTEFYDFVISEEGLSELGIDDKQPPRLLEAYVKTAKVSRKGRTLVLEFGNIAKLKLMTPHPASGTKNLRISSWLEWIVDKRKEPRGFVSRARIDMVRDGTKRDRLRKAIRLKAPLGGLMLFRGQVGSTGQWEFPRNLINYEKKWLNDNFIQIIKVMREKTIEFFTKELNK